MIFYDRKKLIDNIPDYLTDSEKEVVKCNVDDFLSWYIVQNEKDLNHFYDILEYNNESLFDFFSAIIYQYDGFCKIYGKTNCLKDEIDVLYSFFLFFEDDDSLNYYFIEWDYYDEKMTFQELKNEYTKKCKNGYILPLYY